LEDISVDSVFQVQHRNIYENENLSDITDCNKGNLSTMVYDIIMCIVYVKISYMFLLLFFFDNDVLQVV